MQTAHPQLIQNKEQTTQLFCIHHDAETQARYVVWCLDPKTAIFSRVERKPAVLGILSYSLETAEPSLQDFESLQVILMVDDLYYAH